jgi:hypothetical protein
MIDHKAVAMDVLAACDKHKLTNDAATKCLIYTASKLIQKRYGVSDVESAEMLSKGALHYRDEIRRVERMFKNKG